MKIDLLPIVLLFCCGVSVAADFSTQREFSSEVRAFRSETRDSLRLFKLESRLLKKPTIEWEATIGAGYTHGEDGSKTWNAPFEVLVKWNEGATKIKLGGDGYTRSEQGQDVASGVSDLRLTLTHRLLKWEDKASLSGNMALVLPTAGDVGARTAQQRLGLSYLNNFNASWSWGVRGTGSHNNRTFKAGASASGLSGGANFAYSFDPERTLTLDISRSYRRGAGGASALSASFDFPLTNSVVGSVGLSRGLTTGARDNSLEFDLNYAFK